MTPSCFSPPHPPPTSREERGRQIARMGGIRPDGDFYEVPSQSPGSRSYTVDLVEEKCTCPDWETRRKNCKHIEAVYLSIAWKSEASANNVVTDAVKVKRNCPRDWQAYNAAQANEGIYVERLLRALCDGIKDLPRKPGPGRKPIPLKDQVFAAVAKVYSLKTARHTKSDLVQAVEKGNLDRVWHYNVIPNFLGNAASTALLMSLIEESARPLAALENGQFAIDSTGFSTVTYDRWFDQKHGKLCAEHAWVKLHIAVGTVTHAITGVKVTPEADCPQLPELLAQTLKNFDVREMSGDKAYGSKDNHRVLESCGVEAFIPFTVKHTVDPKCEVWTRHLVEFLLNQDRFLAHYHRRSNVESVMWMLKSKFGASVRSKTPIAQVNEVLCKCLCHNLACLVQAIFAAGLAPRFWQDAAPKQATRPVLTLVPQEAQ